MRRITVPTSRTKARRSTLADNETGELRWNRADRPEPVSPRSHYRRIGCAADGHCFFHAVSKTLSQLYQLSYRDGDSIDEKTLSRFETGVKNAVRFPSELFDTPRTRDGNSVYTVKSVAAWSKLQTLLERFRKAYVVQLRRDLATSVAESKEIEEIIKTRFSGAVSMYEEQSTGGKTALELVKDEFVQELLSGGAVRPNLIPLLSEAFDVDIYLLRDRDLESAKSTNSPLYGGQILHETIKGPRSNRMAIVLISVDDAHYEIVGRVTETKTSTGVELTVRTIFSQDEPVVKRLHEMLTERRLKESSQL